MILPSEHASGATSAPVRFPLGQLCGQSILVVSQHLLQFSFQVNLVRIGSRVGWTSGAVDDVDDRASENVAGVFEFAAVVVGQLFG